VGSAISIQEDYKVQIATRIKSVNIIQSLEVTKHKFILGASRTIRRPYDTVNGLSLYFSATIFLKWSRISPAQWNRRQDMDLSPYLRDKMGQHGMEITWVPTNKEEQFVKSSMVTITFDKGVLVLVYMNKGRAINAAAYSTLDHV
jgi:hypothetical protein